jgi:hypothetical protein
MISKAQVKVSANDDIAMEYYRKYLSDFKYFQFDSDFAHLIRLIQSRTCHVVMPITIIDALFSSYILPEVPAPG